MSVASGHPERGAVDRRVRYDLASAALAECSDREIVDLVASGRPLGSGIGGSRVLVDIAGTPVFVKRVPLTHRESLEENVRSTANLFDLPMSCQYGIVSPGFGVWREIVANEMATGWVHDGSAPRFPMMYHYRVMGSPLPEADAAEIAGVMADASSYWRHAPRVEHRMEALASAPAQVILFFEHLPAPLLDWLDDQVVAGLAAADAAITLVERELRAGVAAMNEGGLFHFDAHFGNMLTDGRTVFFADLGLAVSSGFDLSDAERRFLRSNATHDISHTLTRLVDWIVTRLGGIDDWRERDARIERFAGGDDGVLDGLGPVALEIVARYAPIAVIVNDFYRRLRFVDRDTSYPSVEIEDAWRRQGGVSGLGT